MTFESLGTHGYAAWDAVPENGKFQILGVIGILELLGEAAVKPHYMSGGTPGKIPLIWDPLGFTAKLSPEALARKRNSELKNGCALGRCTNTAHHSLRASVSTPAPHCRHGRPASCARTARALQQLDGGSAGRWWGGAVAAACGVAIRGPAVMGW